MNNDGIETTVPVTAAPLPPPIVDADPVDLDLEKRFNGFGQVQSPQERFYGVARETARDQAERAFRSLVDPYHAKLDVQETRRLAQFLYYGNDRAQLSENWRVGEAQEHFLREFKDAYRERLFQVSREYGAPTEETQQLLVFARTDKDADSYGQDRAIARASISFFSNASFRQEDITEEVLRDFRERIGLYQKFFDEFEPAKEEDL